MICYTKFKFAVLFTVFSILCSSLSFAGKLTFSVTPDKALTGSTSKYWSIPTPNYLIDKNSKLTLTDANGQIVSAKFYIVLLWPNENKAKFIRAFSVSTSDELTNPLLTLTWENSNKGNLQAAPNTVTNFHANLSASWLSQSFPTPMLPAKENVKNSWFDNANLHYGKFFENPASNLKYQFPLDKPSIWLYDRAYSFYILYLKTGDIFWKKAGHTAASFYKSKITDNGFFSLKPNDLKYANSQGLLFDYIFYPEVSTKTIIDKIYKMTSTWSTDIKTEGFWTERHHSIALNTAITQWSVTHDPQVHSRIMAFIQSAANYTSLPYNRNCLKHSYLAHEGKELATSVCSPWMTALLVEQFWRYYFLTNNYQSTFIIEKFATYLASSGSFNFTYGKEESSVPKYLTLFNKPDYENNDPWSDINHACDVANAIAKAAYLLKLQKKDYSPLKNQIIKMVKTCHRSMHRTNPNDAWPIVPPRKFNWWYGTTASFTWLLQELDISYKL